MNYRKITAFVGLLALLAIFAYWQSTMNVVPIEKNIDDTISVVPTTKQQDTQLDTSVSEYTTQKHSHDTITDISAHKQDNPVIKYETTQQMQNQTQEVYEALLPDNYEETIQESQEAFDSLDTHKQVEDKEMQAFMQIASQPLEEIETHTEEASEYTIEQMDFPNIDE